MKSSTRNIRWSVGELAARFELETHVLRHWEDKGLLHPERDSAGRRVYGEDDAYRVAAILASKASGMSLDQIRTLVDASVEGRRDALRAHLDELDRRQAELERSRHMTKHALECRAHDITTCPGFQAHVSDIVDGTTQGIRFLAGH
ncbi:MerR family transcriptional regulator [Nocardioides daeguensis]|uniref:MerR family transcriptional regulator n=1 Tax=Nocardioides daeguensis TaxID=908359 RepID=UPI001C48823E|nr:MerR family transcriptional regulator [Nocardioides daeguensis]MBV6727944.1 MerR family transcriptional regulator [Nocardioides daeguensis]MCR1774018.1 MerR family transcriptional regulator [Nocardioides daeguensis]